MLETSGSHTRATAAHRERPTFLEMVQEQAARTPNAVAVECGSSHLTYLELLLRATVTAKALGDRGVGPGQIVGLLGQRSLETLVGLLGILRAGAAYLPLDPGHPPDRLAFIVKDAGMSALLTSGGPAGQVQLPAPVVLAVPAAPPEDWREQDDVVPPVSPGDPAYVIYTSGSTGQPKGVVVHHGALANFLESMRREPGISGSDRVAALTTIGFDIAGLEMWLPLTVGARSVVVPAEVARDGRALAALLEQRHITILQATPATFRLLLDSGWGGSPRLKLLCGGEAMTRSLADRLLPRCGSLWNMYGPTETTVWSTVQRVTPGSGPVPIGRPIANTTVHVLDENLRPVAPGVEGELFIGGDGVALGYLNRPELTAARFLANPLDAAGRTRLYRTGDRVVAQEDGALVYRGRLDDQVKIRGFRVELGEIENALLGNPSIAAAAVVVASPDGGDGARLLAYVVPRPGMRIDTLAERERLRGSLPEYMIPARVVAIEKLPLTPNGKVDRRALPAPENVEDLPFTPPRTETEVRLARVWAEVLGLPRVSADAGFTALGGDSLQAVQVFAAIAREFGKDLPVATLLHAPTVASLAAVIEAGAGAGWDALVPIREAGEPRLFFVHGGGGTVLFLRDIASALPGHVSLYGLQSQGQDGGRITRWRVEEMASHYTEVIRSIQPKGPYLLAGYCFGGLVAFEMARQLRGAGEQVALLALVNTPNHNPLSPADKGEVPPPATPVASRTRRPLRRAKRLVAAVFGGHPIRALRLGAAWRLDALRAHPRVQTAVGLCLHLAVAAGGRVRTSWRPWYIAALTDRAERAYRPRSYDGKLTLISGTGLSTDPLFGWRGLARDIEAQYIGPPQRRRRELIAPPLVTALGAALGELIAGVEFPLSPLVRGVRRP